MPDSSYPIVHDQFCGAGGTSIAITAEGGEATLMRRALFALAGLALGLAASSTLLAAWAARLASGRRR